MRKLKLQSQISVDGYVGGLNGDHDWRTWIWDDKLKAFANHLRGGCDTILLGRKTAETFIPHFEDTVNSLHTNVHLAELSPSKTSITGSKIA